MEEGTETMTTKIRVFVGGLGESVTGDDLRRIFGSLGVVEGLDIVRTKGRSFAYVDFCPSSLNSLSKLFSTVHFFLFPPLLLCIISSIGFARIGEYPFEHVYLHVISSSNSWLGSNLFFFNMRKIFPFFHTNSLLECLISWMKSHGITSASLIWTMGYPFEDAFISLQLVDGSCWFAILPI